MKDDDCGEVMEEEEYEVEKVLDRRVTEAGVVEYLVKWDLTPADILTWLNELLHKYRGSPMVLERESEVVGQPRLVWDDEEVMVVFFDAHWGHYNYYIGDHVHNLRFARMQLQPCFVRFGDEVGNHMCKVVQGPSE